MLQKLIRTTRGQGYVDIVVGVFSLMLVVALAVSFLPVFTAKQQLDLFAAEIVRQAEITGGTEVSGRIATMREQTGLDPEIVWECDYFRGNKVQLDGDISVTLKTTVDVSFFFFGPFQVGITAKASGKSAVYYK